MASPVGLPSSWQPVSSRLTVGDGDGPGTVTWQVGFMTPTGTLAALAETDSAPASFIRRMTNEGTPLAPVRIGGRQWQVSSTPARSQQSMYYTTASGATVLVTGNATLTQLTQLAAALTPARHA